VTDLRRLLDERNERLRDLKKELKSLKDYRVGLNNDLAKRM